MHAARGEPHGKTHAHPQRAAWQKPTAVQGSTTACRLLPRRALPLRPRRVRPSRAPISSAALAYPALCGGGGPRGSEGGDAALSSLCFFRPNSSLKNPPIAAITMTKPFFRNKRIAI